MYAKSIRLTKSFLFAGDVSTHALVKAPGIQDTGAGCGS